MNSYLENIKYVNGPYTQKSSGRLIINTVDFTGRKRTISYPKFLVEVLFNRQLDPYKETVDHIDHDWANNAWDNLRIVSMGKHAREDARRVALVRIRCIWCEELAYKKAAALRHNLKQHKVGPFCGRKCAGEYSSGVQNGRVDVSRYKALSMSQRDVQVEAYYADKGGSTVLDEARPLGITLISEEDIMSMVPRTPPRVKRGVKRSTRVCKKINPCPVCGELPNRSDTIFCSQTCVHKSRRRAKWPSAEELGGLVWKYPTTTIAKQFGVSDTAVSKWCTHYGIEKPPRGYWMKNR